MPSGHYEHRPRARRKLRKNEVRYEYAGVSTAYYRRKGPDWREYCQLRIAQVEQQQEAEIVQSAPKWVELMETVHAARLQMPSTVPSAKAMAMYLAHTVWGWELGRIARICGVHRSMASKYVRRVEEARDDPDFDAAIENMET